MWGYGGERVWGQWGTVPQKTGDNVVYVPSVTVGGGSIFSAVRSTPLPSPKKDIRTVSAHTPPIHRTRSARPRQASRLHAKERLHAGRITRVVTLSSLFETTRFL